MKIQIPMVKAKFPAIDLKELIMTQPMNGVVVCETCWAPNTGFKYERTIDQRVPVEAAYETDWKFPDAPYLIMKDVKYMIEVYKRDKLEWTRLTFPAKRHTCLLEMLHRTDLSNFTSCVNDLLKRNKENLYAECKWDIVDQHKCIFFRLTDTSAMIDNKDLGVLHI